MSNVKQISLKDRGIKAAKAYLQQKGYEIVDTDYECEAGKIELVCLKEDVLIFVKVKTFSVISEGLPKDNFGEDFRQKFEILAANYLSTHDYVDMPVRFDTIAILRIDP